MKTPLLESSFVSGLRGAGVVALALTLAAGCGGDDESPGGAGGSGGVGGSATGGASAAGSAQGGSASSGAGAGGASSAGTGGGGGGSGGTAGGPAFGGHCGPVDKNLLRDFADCPNYEAAANGLPVDDRPIDVTSIVVMGVMANAPLAISRRSPDAALDVEFWATDSSCGSAKTLLGKTTLSGVECVDTTAAEAYSHILVVRRGNAGLEDIRVCSNVECP